MNVVARDELIPKPGPRARTGRGAGKALLRALGKIAVAGGCGRMEWTVLDWNTPSIRFYRGLGTRLHKEWALTRLTGRSAGWRGESPRYWSLAARTGRAFDRAMLP